ncbi:uncharacterized protein [Acropora muricata]|uniref:uncharacterized protein isoform X2 n=1 Tax=Acropora muricata TaxID=159855 RepID=UPI0034E5873E
MSDEELDEVVKDIKKDFCQSGYRMVLGVLRSRGYRIQQRRVMESLRRVDVEGVIMRSLQLKIIHRREYRVYGPNALWHIDTNHKLISSWSQRSELRKESEVDKVKLLDMCSASEANKELIHHENSVFLNRELSYLLECGKILQIDGENVWLSFLGKKNWP